MQEIILATIVSHPGDAELQINKVALIQLFPSGSKLNPGVTKMYISKKLIIPVVLMTLMLNACSGNDDEDSSFDLPANSSATAVTEPIVFEDLVVDFTLPVGALVDGAQQATGISDGDSDGQIYVLTNNQQVVVLSDEGVLLDTIQIPELASVSAQAVSVEDDRLAVLDSQGQLYLQNFGESATQVVSYDYPQMNEYSALASGEDGEWLVVNKQGEKMLYRLQVDGGLNSTPIDSRLVDYQITGADTYDGRLFLLSNRFRDERRSHIFEVNRDGRVITAWAFLVDDELDPSGIVALNADANEFAIVHADAMATITVLEVPGGTQSVDAEGTPLMLVETLAGIADQPSGLACDETIGAYYAVTDFAQVARIDTTGESTTLFSIENTLQGTYESVDINASGELVLLETGRGTNDARLQIFDLNGTELEVINLDTASLGTEYSSLVLDNDQQLYYIANVDQEAVVSLFVFSTSGELQATVALPDEMQEFTLAGMALDEEQELLLVLTEEKVLFVLDADDLELLQSFAVNEVPAPSGIALSGDSIAIASDETDGAIYLFAIP